MYPQVFGKYVLDRELARGGMARVLLATLRGAGGFEKRLVVKQIRDDLASDEEFIRRFVEEAKTTVALAHPNIVPVYELGVELGTYFLAMEYVEGASLAEILRAGGGAGGGLSPEEGAYVGVEVCRALDYAHRRMNVVHGDVTPRNVMVDEEGQVKVIDFGISAPVAMAPSGHGVFGSQGHMPPEQIAGKELTPAADVFAVAVLLIELWSGRAPFRRRTSEETDAAMCARHPKASDADARLLPLDGILARSMSLDPTERPQDADELARALRKSLSLVDLGDVARQLGERVRNVRARPLPPSSDQRPLLQRPPSRPTATQVGSRTFAARDELVVWPGEVAEPSTRKVAPSVPPRSRLRRSFLLLSGAGAAMLVVVAFLVDRGAVTGRKGVASQATAGKPISALAAMAVPSTESPPSATSTTPAFGTPPGSATGVAAFPRVAVEAPAPRGQRAQLLLVGEGTYVTVDGVSRGRAPTRMAVDPGPHTVLFTFPATGESKGDTVVLRAGERGTVTADFTGAQPTIRVRR